MKQDNPRNAHVIKRLHILPEYTHTKQNIQEMARLAVEAWSVGGMEDARQRKMGILPVGLIRIPDELIIIGTDGEEMPWLFEDLFGLTKDKKGLSKEIGLIAWYAIGEGTEPLPLGRRGIKILLEDT